MVEVTYELTPDDFRQGVLARLGNSTLGRARRWIYIGLAGSIPLLLFIAWNYSSEQAAITVVAFGGLAWLFYTLDWWLPYLSARRRFTGTSLGLGKISLGASQDGLRFNTRRGTDIVSWESYLGWCENEYVIVLNGSPLISIVIPKSAFLPTQLSDFTTLLRTKLPTNPKS